MLPVLLAVAQDTPPPVGGVLAQLMFLAFLVVMLVVPFFLASRADRQPSATAPDDAPLPPGSLFTSRRERRLWLWTLAVVVAIYSTLGPMAELAAFLRARNLLRLTTGAVLLGVLMILVVPWLKKRPGPREIGAAIGIGAIYLTTLIRLPVPEARSHLFEYGLVAMFIYLALQERQRNGRRVPLPAFLALVATTLIGWIDEVIQWFLPNRVYDLVDVGFNAIAAFMALAALLLMSWARSWDIWSRLDRLDR